MRVTRGGIALAAVLAGMVMLAVPATSAAAPAPGFFSVKIGGAQQQIPWTEPRIAIGPDGTRWAVTNDPATATAIVFYSTDGGHTWTKTPANPVGQTSATPDVDIVVTRTGRVIASELDDAGINFPTSYTDDRGKTWHQSTGSTQVADQDRQWFAVGPDDPQTHQPTVYLLFHNLASGNVQHNMFVATSKDGGATFGVPVPITLPPGEAYRDLQCADSGGPSTIFVNQKDGTVYALFTTRATPTQGVDLGGCAPLVTGQPLEFNIVAGTRVWLAESKDEGQTWTNSLAVDDAATGQIVSMQLAYAGLDTLGNLYVAYPESAHQYPDYSGAGIKYTFAAPAADAANLKWAPSRTILPVQPGTPGHVLVHMTVGEPGQMTLAYWTGVPGGPDNAVWYETVAQVLNGLDPSPSVAETRISNVPTDTGTASKLMGACHDVGPPSGIINGLACDRSPDVWGMAVDSSCNTTMIWPAVDNKASGNDPGTWISTQDSGPSLCSPQQVTGAQVTNVAGNTAAPAACPDRIAPITRFSKHRTRLRLRRHTLSLRFAGTSRDAGCRTANLISARIGVRRVAVSVQKVRGKGVGKNCRFVKRNGRLTGWRNCRRPVLLPARGTSRWSFKARYVLPAGHYRMVARATDLSGNKEKPARGRNIVSFTVG